MKLFRWYLENGGDVVRFGSAYCLNGELQNHSDRALKKMFLCDFSWDTTTEGILIKSAINNLNNLRKRSSWTAALQSWNAIKWDVVLSTAMDVTVRAVPQDNLTRYAYLLWLLCEHTYNARASAHLNTYTLTQHTHTHTYTHTHTHICTHARTRTHARTHTRTRIMAQKHTHTHTHKHTHTHTHTHTHSHTHTHTHTTHVRARIMAQKHRSEPGQSVIQHFRFTVKKIPAKLCSRPYPLLSLDSFAPCFHEKI